MTGTQPMADSDTGRIGPGRFVLVVGPSGAGKDTLIDLARDACAGDPMIVFARRAVTREASAFENNSQVSEQAFREARDAGAFAVSWRAHDLSYGLTTEINDDIRAGRTVIANVSRAVVAQMRATYRNVVVVFVTAPPHVLAARLAARSRPSDGVIADRLSRASPDTPADIVIENIGRAEDHARELIAVIRQV